MKNRVAAIAALACLASCGIPSPRVNRVTDKQAAQIKPGMSVLEVRKVIGRPWQLVLSPSRPDQELHRHVMTKKPYDIRVDEDHDGHDEVYTWSQYRVLELVYVDGKLVGPGGEGR